VPVGNFCEPAAPSKGETAVPAAFNSMNNHSCPVCRRGAPSPPPRQLRHWTVNAAVSTVIGSLSAAGTEIDRRYVDPLCSAR